ncbi:MAG: threonylcarbamoyl-AMP synthase [Candidatus Omnitrophica bacterium]|nr:threonylcarbamoyl-AMP synthase [Candidatus Omnitrophota bacterium]
MTNTNLATPILINRRKRKTEKRILRKTEIYAINPDKPNIKIIKKAARILKEGGIIAFPTETVYGLFTNSLDKNAVKRLYEIKKRPRNKPFTVLINRFSDLDKFDVKITPYAKKILEKFWPGALTAILKTEEGKKIGFRMPDYRAVSMLLEETKLPLFAPSANLSGKKECVNAKSILSTFNGKIDMIIDAGKSPIGIPSTVVDLTNDKPKILREGAIKLEDISVIP